MNPEPQSGGNHDGHDVFKPDETVSVRTADTTPTPTPATSATPPPVAAAASVLPASAQSESSGSADSPYQPFQPPEPEEQHFFRAEQAAAATPPTLNAYPSPQFDPMPDADPRASFDPSMQQVGRSVIWTAAEFVSHEKAQDWYLKFGGIALVVVILAGLITRDIFSTVVAFLVCAIFGFAAGRQPRQMQYGVTDQGVGVGNRFYEYKNFRGYSIGQEGPLLSLNFMPLKRFMPTMSLYFDPTDQERIMEVVGEHLPLEAHVHDAVDRLMKRIRF